MAQRTVYLPAELDDLVEAYGLSLSPLLQAAIRQELGRQGVQPDSMMRGPQRYRKDQGVSDNWPNRR
jgi:hypothetical protein